MTTECHSVRSLRSPEFLSRQLSEVAILKIDDRIARGKPPDFRILTEIADQDHLVDAACHDRLRFLRSPCSQTLARRSMPTVPVHKPHDGVHRVT